MGDVFIDVTRWGLDLRDGSIAIEIVLQVEGAHVRVVCAGTVALRLFTPLHHHHKQASCHKHRHDENKEEAENEDRQRNITGRGVKPLGCLRRCDPVCRRLLGRNHGGHNDIGVIWTQLLRRDDPHILSRKPLGSHAFDVIDYRSRVQLLQPDLHADHIAGALPRVLEQVNLNQCFQLIQNSAYRQVLKVVAAKVEAGERQTREDASRQSFKRLLLRKSS